MRYVAFLIAFLVGITIGMSAAEATELSTESRISETGESSGELPPVLIDEALATLILGDEKLCCRVERVDQKLGELVWGPLYWRRLKILCPRIRPTAIC